MKRKGDEELKPTIKVAAKRTREEDAKPIVRGNKKANDEQRAAAPVRAGNRPASKWNDMDRHEFLQFLMRKGLMSEADAIVYFKRIVPSASDAEFRAFVGELCQSMGHLNYTVKRQKTPCDDCVYVALVNRVVDGPTKVASKLKPEHLNFTRFLLEKMATADGSFLYKSTAVNFGGEAAAAAQRLNDKVDVKKLKLKPSEAEEVLAVLVSEGFLKSEGNKYSLGPRTFLELGSFLEGLEGLDEVLKAKMEALH